MSPSTHLPHVLSLFLVLTHVTCTQERGQKKKNPPCFWVEAILKYLHGFFPTSRALILQLREPMWGHLQLLILSVRTMALDSGK